MLYFDDNLQYKRLENGTVEYTIKNETHTLLRPLTEALRKHVDITYVAYLEVHPLKKVMKLLVKSKHNNETEIVLGKNYFPRKIIQN